MNMIALSWMVISGSLLLVVLAGVAAYWQVLRRLEAVAALQICQSQLEQHMAASHQKDDELRELSAGLRAEKAHVEQLQRQVEFAQQEASRLRTEYHDQFAQLVEVQSAACAARAQYGQLLQQHDELKQASIRLQQVHDVLQDRFAALTKEHATLSSTLDQKQQHFAEQQQLLKESRNQLKLEFEQLAGQIFEAKGQAFSQYSQQSLDALLKPFREQIEGFRTKVEDIHHKDVQQQAALTQELHHLKELNRQITQEAQDLTTALKGQKKAQGNWGELILENVLERSGLVNGKDFKREVSFTGESNRQRPDVIVYLPQGKHLIIDAKVSLNAYIGHSLDKAQDAYKKACDQLVSGKANLVKQVSDFRQLGVAVKGELNEVWVDRADLELNLISQMPAEQQA